MRVDTGYSCRAPLSREQLAVRGQLAVAEKQRERHYLERNRVREAERRMGNQAGKGPKCEIETVSREASDLVTQYRNLKGNHKSLTVKKLRQSELSNISDGDDRIRKSQDIENKIEQMFANDKEIDFRRYLKWEITKGGSAEELASKLESLFNYIDDGDGLLTPEELVKLEASLDVTLTVDQAEVIIRDFDANGDGRMSLDELIFYHTSTHGT